MGTPVESVYDAFMAKILDDEWGLWGEEDRKRDQLELLRGAIPYFKFPRVSIALNAAGTNFEGDLGPQEIQILATYMKCEWLNRSILTWERIKPLYEERDFSEANMLSKLYDALESERKRARVLEGYYYRSVDFNPWDYTRLAGDQSG